MFKLFLIFFTLFLSSCSLDLNDKEKKDSIKDTTTINKELSDKVSNSAIIPPSIPDLESN